MSAPTRYCPYCASLGDVKREMEAITSWGEDVGSGEDKEFTHPFKLKLENYYFVTLEFWTYRCPECGFIAFFDAEVGER